MNESRSILWESSYGVGVTVIDEQHQKWFQIFNDFNEAVGNGQGQLLVLGTLKALSDYTRYHFSTEQDLFREYNFPQGYSHIEKHKEFIFTLNTLYKDFKKDDQMLSVKAIGALKDWLINHILGTDKEFGEYVSRLKNQ